MKKINFVYIVLITLILISCSQKDATFSITGKIEDSSIKTVVLVKSNYVDTIAYTVVKDGQFLLQGKVENAQKAILLAGRELRIKMILENEIYSIIKTPTLSYANGGKLNNLVYGYKSNKEYVNARRETKATNLGFEGLDMMDKDAVEKAREAFREKYRAENKIVDDYRISILEGNYDALVKLFVLSDYNKYSLDKRFELLSEYEKEIGQHEMLLTLRANYKLWQKKEEIRKSVSTGNPFKEVTAKDLNDNIITLSSVVKKNKYTLLEFWASW